MNLKQMKEGLEYINEICIKEDERWKIYCKLFENVRLGDIGIVKCIAKEELEYCKLEKSKDREELQEHIDSLSLVNKFCIIPYPDDIEHEHREDYLVFMRYQLDGTRGEEYNIVMDCKYFIEMARNGFEIVFEVKE